MNPSDFRSSQNFSTVYLIPKEIPHQITQLSSGFYVLVIIRNKTSDVGKPTYIFEYFIFEVLLVAVR
jgi:hypothetical protein